MDGSQGFGGALENEGNDTSCRARAGKEQQLFFQRRALLGVSRTFALTIPQLPEPLRTVIGNAYLVCRIADTVEDEPRLTAKEKAHFLGCFVDVVAGRASATDFAAELHPLLSDATSAAERDLVKHTASVVLLTRGLRRRQRKAIQRCIRIMAAGTADFSAASAPGLATLRDLDRYCYHVAGVVGETITELLCEYSGKIAERGCLLRAQAADFGRALQLVNIIKDLWDDRARGVCWLPREAFPRVDLSTDGDWAGYDFEAGVLKLVDRARDCLERALEYTLLIPPRERGVRRFLLWTLGLAVLTLRPHPRQTRFPERRNREDHTPPGVGRGDRDKRPGGLERRLAMAVPGLDATAGSLLRRQRARAWFTPQKAGVEFLDRGYGPRVLAAVACVLLVSVDRTSGRMWASGTEEPAEARAAFADGRWLVAADLGGALQARRAVWRWPRTHCPSMHTTWRRRPSAWSCSGRAIRLAEEAVRLQPSDPWVRFQLAHAVGRYAQSIPPMAAFREGYVGRSRQLVEDVLALDPDMMSMPACSSAHGMRTSWHRRARWSRA